MENWMKTSPVKQHCTKHALAFRRVILSAAGTLLLATFALLKGHPQVSGQDASTQSNTPQARAALRAIALDEILNPAKSQPALTPESLAAAEAISYPIPFGVNMTPAELAAAEAIANPIRDASLMTPEQQKALASMLGAQPAAQIPAPALWFFDTDPSQIQVVQPEPDPIVLPVEVDNPAMP
jgi:hypothetical protein